MEIMINRYDEIYYEKKGQLVKSDVQFESEGHLLQTVRGILTSFGRDVNESNPIVDLRLSDGTLMNVVIPPIAVEGTIVTMRKFTRHQFTFDDLIGFGSLTPENLVFLEACIKSRVNLIMAGGTGSGKTTTLYACLQELNEPDVKIITTEDPVELQIDGLIQCAVKEDIGLTFARCLRAILRQDPDIVMVGEIRDRETAEIAVEASLTGHLVLSTLHTNSAPETITRLLDMEVEPFLITASLEAVIAQRLVRKLCQDCRTKYKPDNEEVEMLGLPEAWANDPKLKLYKSEGCAACDYTGFKGRIGLFEMISLDEHICELILDRAMSKDIKAYARKNLGMRTLREEGIIKSRKGRTSAEEVITHTDKDE